MTVNCVEESAVLADRQVWKQRPDMPSETQSPVTVGKWIRSELVLQSGSSITVDARELEPGWLYPLLKQLQELLQLGRNWDSYGGCPIEPKAVEVALRIAGDVLSAEASPPTVVPTSQGGVQLEWHANGIDLEIAVSPSGAVNAYYYNRTTGQVWEDEGLKRATHQDRLREMTAQVG